MVTTTDINAPAVTTLVDTTTSTQYVYIGKAEIGTLKSAAAWTVFRIDTTNGANIEWADLGSNNQIWDNRVSLTYT